MRRDFLRILMPEVIFNADRIGQIKSFLDQDVRGHNRWHRGVPATAAVGPSIPAASSLFKCRLRTDGGQEQPQRCRQAEPEREDAAMVDYEIFELGDVQLQLGATLRD